MFLLLLRPWKIFILFFPEQSSAWWLGGKPSPWRQQARPSLPRVRGLDKKNWWTTVYIVVTKCYMVGMFMGRIVTSMEYLGQTGSCHKDWTEGWIWLNVNAPPITHFSMTHFMQAKLYNTILHTALRIVNLNLKKKQVHTTAERNNLPHIVWGTMNYKLGMLCIAS